MGNTPSTHQIILYSSPDFSGERLHLQLGDYKNLRLQILDFDPRSLGSLKVGPRTVLELFKRDRFKGEKWVIKNETQDEIKDLSSMGKVGPVMSIRVQSIGEYVPTPPDLSPDPEPEIVTLKPESPKPKQEVDEETEEEVAFTKQPVPVTNGMTTMEEQETRRVRDPPAKSISATYQEDRSGMALDGVDENAVSQEMVFKRPTVEPEVVIAPKNGKPVQMKQIDGACVLREIAHGDKSDINAEYLNQVREQCTYKLKIMADQKAKVENQGEDINMKVEQTDSVKIEGFVSKCYYGGILHTLLALIILFWAFYLVTKLRD